MKTRILLLACVVSLVMAGSLFAGEPDQAAPAAVSKSAIVSMDEARAIALEKVPGGELSSEELGRQAGKLVYTFDFRVAGKKGVDVVTVNASDGTVLTVVHKSEWAARRDAQAKRRKRE